LEGWTFPNLRQEKRGNDDEVEIQMLQKKKKKQKKQKKRKKKRKESPHMASLGR